MPKTVKKKGKNKFHNRLTSVQLCTNLVKHKIRRDLI